MNEFEKSIQRYLDQKASTDSAFAEKYNKADKTIAGCCKYIISEVKKTGRSGFADEEIFGMAIHFFDEESIKAPESVPGCKVVTNVSKKAPAKVELSKEDQERLKERAEREFMEREIEGIRKRKIEAGKRRKAEDQESMRREEEKQGSLF